MFDRLLCCKQLRYSGMMETIRIRRAGYPIRHTFYEFVERYRFLIPNIPPVHQVDDCKEVTSKICASVLEKSDYQLGKTKVFLKDAHDLYLEQERDRVQTQSIITLQRAIRCWYYRKKFLQYRDASIVIQKNFRAFSQQRKYKIMRIGYLRLQALIRSRVMTAQFKYVRNVIISFQATCRGYLVRKEFTSRQLAAIKIQSFIRGFIARRQYARMLTEHRKLLEAIKLKEQEEHSLMKKMNPKKAKEIAEQKFNERIMEFESQKKEEEIEDKLKIAKKMAVITDAAHKQEEFLDDSKLVDAMFDFLPRTDNANENNGAAAAFADLDRFTGAMAADGSSSDGAAVPPVPQQQEDLSEYKFHKFAATYFQANANSQYLRKPLKQPLLLLQTQGDCMASIALWITILRFMGDLGEPNFHTMGRVSIRKLVLCFTYR